MKILFTLLGLSIPQAFADWKMPACANNNCLEAGVNAIKGYMNGTGVISDRPLSVAIQDMVVYFLSFLSLIAVIYVMWAGAQMLLFPANEGTNEKTKKIIVSVILGITIIWFAWWIVSSTFFVLSGSVTSINS